MFVSCFRTLADIFVSGVVVFVFVFLFVCNLTEIRNETRTAGEADKTEQL